MPAVMEQIDLSGPLNMMEIQSPADSMQNIIKDDDYTSTIRLSAWEQIE